MKRSILWVLMAMAILSLAACSFPTMVDGYNRPADLTLYNWSNSEDDDVLAIDDRDAISQDGEENYVIAHDYNIDVPDDAVIDGIEVLLQHATWNGNTDDEDTLGVKLMYGGRELETTTTYTDTADDTYSGWDDNFKERLFGSPTDTWGRTWSPADLSNGNFGVRFTCITSVPEYSATVDICWVKVYYH